MDNLYILNAGCVLQQVRNTVDRFNAMQSNVQAVYSSGGSVKCIERMQKGEPCDLLISADDAIIASMMMPQWTDGYYVFAGNSMVLAPSASKQIMLLKNRPLVPRLGNNHNCIFWGFIVLSSKIENEVVRRG